MISACSLRKFAVIGLLALLPVSAAAQGINSYSPVTDVRLANPEPENWLMYRRTYDS